MHERRTSCTCTVCGGVTKKLKKANLIANPSLDIPKNLILKQNKKKEIDEIAKMDDNLEYQCKTTNRKFIKQKTYNFDSQQQKNKLLFSQKTFQANSSNSEFTHNFPRIEKGENENTKIESLSSLSETQIKFKPKISLQTALALYQPKFYQNLEKIKISSVVDLKIDNKEIINDNYYQIGTTKCQSKSNNFSTYLNKQCQIINNLKLMKFTKNTKHFRNSQSFQPQQAKTQTNQKNIVKTAKQQGMQNRTFIELYRTQFPQRKFIKQSFR